MRKDNIILITKDAMCCEYLPTYGNKYNKTPNIDTLASKGTVFRKHYSGAASTIMSNICMFTGKFSHESELDDYKETNLKYQGETLFDKANALGYETHIIWDKAWFTARTVEYYDCYGRNTIFHSLDDLRQGVGGHYHRTEALSQEDAKTKKVYDDIEAELKKIRTSSKKQFVWLHIPHVINGRVGYGQDIDAFDHIVGIARKYFDDDAIYLSADHGNMNGAKNKFCYGFDLCESAIKIPLITPKMEDKEYVNNLSSNVDLYSIIFEKTVPYRDIVYCDTAFYAQAHRKIAILDGRFKYIYSKFHKSEELFDLDCNPDESCNLINECFYDFDRGNITLLRELYFHPDWELVDEKRVFFRNELKKIWKTGTFKQEIIPKLKYNIKYYFIHRKEKRAFERKTKMEFKSNTMGGN